ncbi:MAG: carbohydrate kinase family protein [Chloroflexi bacterium]|nr:carbohydrate kinase family protein [Chloroflexota bacterium]
MSIVITGSIAWDHIMDFPGYFKDHILPEKVHMLNVSFLVNCLKRQRGGCATNIAYNLSLLGERPSIMATVGSDFEDYRLWFLANEIDVSGIAVIDGEYTASAFVTTDKADNQITGFYPGAMSYADTLSFANLDYQSIEIAIISPNSPQAMVKYAEECKQLHIPYIFDPSLEPGAITESARGAKVLIANDYEYEMIRNKTGLSVDDLVDYAEIVIVTLGDKGSLIRTKQETVNVPPAKPRRVIDPTGAGDAYRAGIIKGLLRDYNLAKMGKVAALVSVYGLEEYGTTLHRFTMPEFSERFMENFGEAL